MIRKEEVDDDDFDDVPPLEDMSHFIKQKPVVEDRRPIVSTSTSTAQPNQNLKTQTQNQKKEKEFSSLQKGFFNKAPTKAKAPPKSKKPLDDIPFIRADLNQQKKNPLEFSEIKDAMATQFEKTRNEWMTPSFMEKIEKSPVLSKAFQDDRFLTISQSLARDPVGTMQKVSREMPHFIPALQEFTALIGEAMEAKAEEEEKKKQPKLDDFEQGLVDRLMKDERVQNALKDPKIQDLLLQLRTDPTQTIARIMQTSPPDTRGKIQVLIECGLLSVVQ